MHFARVPFIDGSEQFVHESIQCFVVTFERLRDLCVDMHDLLSPDELERQKAYRLESDREHYGFSHIFLRIVLAHAAQQSPEPEALRIVAKSLVFEADPLGKPVCTGKTPVIPAFSLSRSKLACALGLGWNRSFGVDVESISQIEHMTPSMLAYAFSTREQDYIARSDSPKEDALKLWTRKEALVKACGFGLRLPITQVETLLMSDQPLALPREFGSVTDWQLFTKGVASEVFSLALRR